MCPIFKVGELAAVVEESVFLKEVDVALHGIGAQSVPREASVAEAARWCLDELSGALLAGRRRRVVTAACHPPLTGVFAPVDVDAIRADPACTAEYFALVLRDWGIGSGAPSLVQPGIADVARRLDMTTGGVHGLHSRVPVPDDVVIDWSIEYVPFAMLSGDVGMLYAFTAAPDGYRP